MKVAIITPIHSEDEHIVEKMMDSVKNQDHPCTHIIVSDGVDPNFSSKYEAELHEVSDRLKYLKLPSNFNDNGNTPRGVGSILAEKMEFDGVGYLDADNWFRPNHVRSLIELHQSKYCDVACSRRTLHHFFTEEDFGFVDAHDNNTFVDTSAYMFFQAAFKFFPIWLNMPKFLSPVCDRVMYRAIQDSGVSISHSNVQSLAFRARYAAYYKDDDPLLQQNFLKDNRVLAGAYRTWYELSDEQKQLWRARLGFAYDVPSVW